MGKKDRIKRQRALAKEQGESKPKLPLPSVDEFVADIQPDPKARERLQTIMGFCLTGEKSEYVFVFRGDGSNGKTTMAKMLRNISPFTVTQSPDFLFRSFNNEDRIVNLVGKSSRCLIVDDFPKDKELRVDTLETIMENTRAKIIIITDRMTDFNVGEEFKSKMIYVDFPTKFV
jgi:phage/plasmid-associated DNA primase